MLTRIQDTAPGATQLYSAKSALFTAGVGDRGTYFDSTGSFTITLDTTGMSAGWSAWFRTVSGTQTLDPTGGTLINGATTYASANAGDVILVEYTGTAFIISQSQLPAAVAITGGTINNTTIGATTATTGRFTTITATALTSGRVPFVSTAGLIVDSSTFTWSGTNLTISASGAQIILGDGTAATAFYFQGGAGTERAFNFRTGSSNRWRLRANTTAEGGSNAGSDFEFIAFDDSASSLGAALTLTRSTLAMVVGTSSLGSLTIAKTTGTTLTISSTQASTTTATGALLVAGGAGIAGRLCAGSLLASGLTSGRVPYVTTGGLLTDSAAFMFNGTTTASVGDGTVAIALNVNGANATNRDIGWQTAGSIRWRMRVTSNESGSDAGSTFNLSAYDDAGANIDTPISILRVAGGAATVARPIAANSTTDSTTIATGAIICAGGIGVAKRLTLDGATGKTIKYVNGTANAAVAVTFGAVGPTGSTAGNQVGWLRVDVNGTDRYIPYW